MRGRLTGKLDIFVTKKDTTERVLFYPLFLMLHPSNNIISLWGSVKYSAPASVMTTSSSKPR